MWLGLTLEILAVNRYVFERMLSSLTRKISDRARPEANLVHVHTTDVAVTHAALVFGPQLEPSFASPEGRQLWQLYMTELVSLDPIDQAPGVSFPTLKVRSPYIVRVLATPAFRTAILALTPTLAPPLTAMTLDPLIWFISSNGSQGVSVHGKPRSNLVADARSKKSHESQSTAGFLLNQHTVGKVLQFAAAEFVCGQGSRHQLQLAYVLLYPVHWSDAADMHFIRVDEASPTFISALQVGTSVMAFGRATDPALDANVEFVIDISTTK